MKTLVLASALGLAIAAPAHALLISSASSTGGALTAGCNTSDAGSGILTANCSGGGFTAIALTASGPPLLNAPDLTATTLTVTTAPLTTATMLTVDIASSGFAFPGGPLTALLTVNNLIGSGTGPFTLSAISPAGSVSQTFTGSGAATGGPTVFPAFTTDSARFELTFGASALPQSVDATIEIVGVANVPEPGSIAMLGSGILGLGMLSMIRRRRRD